MKKGDKVTIKSTGECGKVVACSNSKYSIMLDSGSPFVAQEEDIEIYKKGGTIKNQYKGRLPNDIWDSLDKAQRSHFLFDHKKVIEKAAGKELNIQIFKECSWAELQEKDFQLGADIKYDFSVHVKDGQYAKGGNTQSRSKKMKETMSLNDAEELFNNSVCCPVPYALHNANNSDSKIQSYLKKESKKQGKELINATFAGNSIYILSPTKNITVGDVTEKDYDSFWEKRNTLDDKGEMYRTGGVAGSKHVSVTKGFRMPHGYKAVKGKDKNRRYSKGHPKVNVDKGWRMPKSYKTVDAAYNQKYEKGGNANEFNYSIGGL